MGFFADLVNSHGLRNVPIFGVEYTWSNMSLNPSLSKLDRFLLSPGWDASFPFSKGLACPRPISDHIPIVLCGKMPKGNPKPFKFENMWLKSPDFVELVRGWWDSFELSRRPGQRLRLKLKLLCDKLRVWNKEVFGNVDQKKTQLLEEI